MTTTVAARRHHDPGDHGGTTTGPAGWTAERRGRRARPRHFLMCPPTHFDVAYAINPWMDPTVPVDRARAMRQWQALVATYEGLGHRVSRLAPVAGLPDMVFTANGALVVDGRALVARFAHHQRRAEADHHLAWVRDHVDAAARRATVANEAEGDLLVVGDLVLAGTGFRTDPASHAEVATIFDLEVVTLELVDPRFYHLDVAVAVLDDRTVACFPPALSPASLDRLRAHVPEVIEVAEADALVLGCNAVSDGRHVVVDERATGLHASLSAAGFEPVPVAVDAFTRAGGGIKCLSMEVRPVPRRSSGPEPGTVVRAIGGPAARGPATPHLHGPDAVTPHPVHQPVHDHPGGAR